MAIPKLDLTSFEPILLNGDFVLVSGSEEVVQDLTVALRIFRKEWAFDENVGLDWFGRVFWDRPQALRDAEIKRVILGVEGVDSIVSYDTRENLDESIDVEFSVLTSDGIVAVTTPGVITKEYFDASELAPAGNASPIISFVKTENFLELTIDATGSSDPDGTIATLVVSFGDGGLAVDASAGPVVHVYAAGSYFWTITATDDEGAVSTTSGTFVAAAEPVPNVPPVASFSFSSVDLVLTVDGSASNDSDGTLVEVEYNWADGTAFGASLSGTHTFATAGIYFVALKVTDDDGESHTLTQSVTITAGVVTIPEPTGTGLTYWDVFRLFEEPVGLVSLLTSSGASSTVMSATGAARPTATGSSVLWDGVANEMECGSASDFNWITAVGGDWVIQFIFKADVAFATGNHRLFATVNSIPNRGIYIQIDSGTMRIYGYNSSTGDNSPLSSIAWDGSWVAITLRFDSSHKDIYKWQNTGYAKDSNWSLVPEAGDQHIPMTWGSGGGFAHSVLNMRDFRTAKVLGLTVTAAVEYLLWAIKWDLLT